MAIMNESDIKETILISVVVMLSAVLAHGIREYSAITWAIGILTGFFLKMSLK
jgi:hypothetical protein